MLVDEMGLMQKINREIIDKVQPTPSKGKETYYRSDMNKFLNEMQEILKTEIKTYISQDMKSNIQQLVTQELKQTLNSHSSRKLDEFCETTNVSVNNIYQNADLNFFS